jgi:DNA-binding NtrC family response regulator
MSLQVLLVEDDATTRRVIEGILLSRGYEVTAVADAESAWPLCTERPYPLIVLDWMLPGLDGVSLCARLRTLPHGDRSIVVMLTGRDRPEDLRAVLDAGADDYITKPVDPQRLHIRLAIAERQWQNLASRKDAEARSATFLGELERSRDDLLSILNQLRIGSAITDEDGHLTFLSAACRPLFGLSREPLPASTWRDAIPLCQADKDRLAELCALSPAERTKLSTCIELAGGRQYWVDIEVQDDPRSPQRKIFYFYDVSEVHDLRRLLDEKAHFEGLLGKSEVMQKLFEQIRDVSRVDSTVLIEGETGTGKELVARAIHAASRRSDRPFVAVNCAGLTESILGSQLFGHRRGAFTGAIDDQKGLLEAADGGTLFLDEIGDVPMAVQTSLLRVLQEREIVRLGESKPRKIDVRVLAATHHNLVDDVARGTFRSDLLYRIRVARIHVPALRARREDIPLLVASFLSQHRAATGKQVIEISSEAMRMLLEHGWPGNVRELRSAIEFAVIGCRGAVIEAGDLPDEIRNPSFPEPPRPSSPEEEHRRILAAIERAGGNRAHAARLLGISRATFYRRLSELGVPPKLD